MAQQEYNQHPEGTPFTEDIRWIYEFLRFETERLKFQTKARKEGDLVLNNILEKVHEDEMIEERKKFLEVIQSKEFLDQKLLKRNRINSQRTRELDKKFKHQRK